MINTSFDKAQLAETIAAIAAELPGATIDSREGNYSHCIALDSEAAIHFSYNQREHRLHISGYWPRSRVAGEGYKIFSPSGLYPRVEDTSINVSAGKGAKQIAADINRRFLPNYRAVLARCLERRQQAEDYAAKQSDLARSIATSLGVGLKLGDRATNFDLPKNLNEETSAYGSIEVSGNTVEFEIRSLESARALKLIEFLKTL